MKMNNVYDIVQLYNKAKALLRLLNLADNETLVISIYPHFGGINADRMSKILELHLCDIKSDLTENLKHTLNEITKLGVDLSQDKVKWPSELLPKRVDQLID